jgi:hypothetical protein
MKFIIILALFTVCVSSCKHDSSSESSPLKANAEIIAFRSEKCVCCWGWVIRMGADTIKADMLPNSDLVGYNITTPIPVYIELGGIKQLCSAMNTDDPFYRKNYYEVKRLHVIP